MTSPRMATAARALVAEDRQLEFPPDVHGGVDRAATKKQGSRGGQALGTESHQDALRSPSRPWIRRCSGQAQIGLWTLALLEVFAQCEGGAQLTCSKLVSGPCKGLNADG